MTASQSLDDANGGSTTANSFRVIPSRTSRSQESVKGRRYGRARSVQNCCVPFDEVKTLAARKCKVCEWQGETVERPGEVVDCPWCHGPTDLVRGAPAPEPMA